MPVQTFPAPRKGWIANTSLVNSPKDAAEVLDNIIPTAQGARLRSGSEKHATLGDVVRRMFVYSSGGTEEMFATTDADIYDVSNPADADTEETPIASGFGDGDWSAQQFSTSAGEYMVAVNGTDYMQLYDGTDMVPVAAAGLNELPYDALTAEFAIGETVTGGSSGASAEIIGISKTSATEGTLQVGTITSGPFTDDETITSASGSATCDGGSSSGSTFAISGKATTAFSHVWAFKNRLWFVEKDTNSAWYLATNSISGTATEFPLRGVFNLGGDLLFGATWSLDSGDGLDDVIIFASTRGEIAVYQGTDPATDFVLSGVYRLGVPLNKHAYFKAGGDLVIGTEDGLNPVSQAVRKDRAALAQSALTYPIEEAWYEAVSSRTSTNPISLTLWQAENLLIVGTPAIVGTDNVAFVANARTGAWCRFTGWDVRCGAVFNDTYYFGTAGSIILKADTGGNDNGSPFAGLWVPKFNEDKPTQKSARLARFRARAVETYEIGMRCFSDYQVDEFSSNVATSSDDTNTWGTGEWGTMVWGGTGYRSRLSEWQSVAGFGASLAPAVRVEINRTNKPDLEFIACDLVYDEGNIL